MDAQFSNYDMPQSEAAWSPYYFEGPATINPVNLQIDSSFEDISQEDFTDALLFQQVMEANFEAPLQPICSDPASTHHQMGQSLSAQYQGQYTGMYQPHQYQSAQPQSTFTDVYQSGQDWSHNNSPANWEPIRGPTGVNPPQPGYNFSELDETLYLGEVDDDQDPALVTVVLPTAPQDGQSFGSIEDVPAADLAKLDGFSFPGGIDDSALTLAPAISAPVPTQGTASRKRKRRSAEESGFPARPKEKMVFLCRYGCKGSFASAETLQNHMCNVHNLVHPQEQRFKRCTKCDRCYLHQQRSAGENHDMVTCRGPGKPMHKWNVQTPRTMQELGDTFSRRGDPVISAHLKVSKADWLAGKVPPVPPIPAIAIPDTFEAAQMRAQKRKFQREQSQS